MPESPTGFQFSCKIILFQCNMALLIYEAQARCLSFTALTSSITFLNGTNNIDLLSPEWMLPCAPHSEMQFSRKTNKQTNNTKKLKNHHNYFSLLTKYQYQWLDREFFFYGLGQQRKMPFRAFVFLLVIVIGSRRHSVVRKTFF